MSICLMDFLGKNTMNYKEEIAKMKAVADRIKKDATPEEIKAELEDVADVITVCGINLVMPKGMGGALPPDVIASFVEALVDKGELEFGEDGNLHPTDMAEQGVVKGMTITPDEDGYLEVEDMDPNEFDNRLDS